ncbi:MAG: AraC family transcriptional regulator [Alphaproteobacteria bacterium]|nr:AraC family transcriptional regulator [Alphaproteobacteria bacterium]
MKSKLYNCAMNASKAQVTRISGIEVAEDRFTSVNGPPLTTLPSWGMLIETEEVAYNLHPAIDFEVHYVVSDYVLIHGYNGVEGRFALDDGAIGPWRLDARTTCLIPPGQRVRVIANTPFEFIGLGISPARVHRVAAQVGQDWPGLETMFSTLDAGLATLCAEIRRCMIAEPMASGGYLDCLTDAVLTRLIGWHLAPMSESAEGREMLSPAMARRVGQMIEDRIDGPIRVGDLAEAAGLSRAHFSRAFSHNFGAPPRDYILSRRIAHARGLLTDTDLSASEIAMRCGFANPSHLTTSFRQEIGLTPTDYRRAMTENQPS